ncbi:SusC/RagA family TonB-linked outer membrane protein [Agriterribacter sp.]|uniref:SusC/RagA family TonB-linked outer membrane protein n=1 Tax=Agriterribacter sp. TaxID=2821509 RepID=UPI002B81B498|nr:SusC/RagA family TonB-linked outer membrane protein [Agriterribacter sp.]HTN06564.1 SusC/RagA family TonB-linked outer membrane protein [Agriterribacter sp.]
MRMFNLKSCLLITCICFALLGWAQGRKISGKVTSKDGEPLSGVSITVKGKTTGAFTNADGNFTLDAAEGDVLVISSVGYNNAEFTISAKATATIILTAAESSKLDEVVVVGYGTAKRSKLTSSISKLDNKVLETGLRSNPAQALAGTIPGLRVSTGTGRPGSLPSIILRGGTNFDGSGSPLILMDGQVRESLSDINPEDIASMEVLKDASATAIYGARASNGVILITSKRGKAGQSSITLNVKRGTSYLNVPYNFLNAEDYIKWTRMGVVQAIINNTFGTVASNSALSAVGPRSTGNVYKDSATGPVLDGNYDNRAIWSVMRLNDLNRELLNQPGWKTMKDAVLTNDQGNYDPNGTYADLIYKDFNYGDYGLYNKATVQEYNVGMSGGNDRGSYFANVGYYDEGGLSLKTFYKRLTFTLNGDYKIKDWLKSESSLQFNKANWRDQSLQNGEGNYWGRMLSAPPTMRGTNANGELILGRDASDGNPIINIDKYKRSNQTDKFTLGQSFRVDILKDLYVKLGAIWMYDEGIAESFNQDFRTGRLSKTDPNLGWNRTRISEASFGRTIRQTYNAIVNYHTGFLGRNNIDAMAGFEYYDAYAKGVYAAGAQAPTDDFQDLQYTLNNATTQTRTTDSYHSRDRIMSGFGRLLYDWDGKYLASFTVRRDGVSRLTRDNQYGTFPAASVGWMMHRENFMSSARNWLSYLKLRASWGKNGNIGIGTSNAVGAYEVQGSYGSQQPYNGSIGFLQTGIANPLLRWEKTNTTELGADMGFLNNRLNASIAYYNRITEDKLAFIDLPTSSGVSSVRTNNGSMRNRGFEAEASYKIIQGKNLTWQVNANAAWNKNTLLKLPFNGNDKNRQGGTQIYDPATGQLIWVGGFQEGQEWGELFGFVAEGIIRTQKDLEDYNKFDEAAKAAYQNGGAGRGVASRKLIDQYNLNAGRLPNNPLYIATQLGDVMWKDIDKNDTIDYRDRVSLGRTLPRWTGGFSTTVSWKGLSLFARLDFAFGHIQQDFQQMWSLASAQGEFNATDIVKDTWTPDNPNAKYPRYSWADQLNTKNFDRPSSMFFVNSGYLAFREVSLSYALPTDLLKQAKISGLRLTVTGQNLGYLTNSLINLPERTGLQSSAYTIPTQLVFGANLTF